MGDIGMHERELAIVRSLGRPVLGQGFQAAKQKLNQRFWCRKSTIKLLKQNQQFDSIQKR